MFFIDEIFAQHPRALPVPWLRFGVSRRFRNLLHETAHKFQWNVAASRLHNDVCHISIVLTPQDVAENRGPNRTLVVNILGQAVAY